LAIPLRPQLPNFLNPAPPPAMPAAVPAVPSVPGPPATSGGPQIDFMTWLNRIASGQGYNGRKPKFDRAAQQAVNARFARPQQMPGVPAQQGTDFPFLRQLLGGFSLPQIPRS
jgi:hypothetical protein